jgi:GTPase SAR1 family protein
LAKDGHNLVVIGQGGCGKTFLIKQIVNYVRSKGQSMALENTLRYWRTQKRENMSLKDQDYHTNVDFECILIAEIARAKDIPPATTNELQKAIKSINR